MAVRSSTKEEVLGIVNEINDAVEPGSVTNRMVALVLNYLVVSLVNDETMSDFQEVISALRGRVNSISNALDTLTSGDTTSAIESFNEVIAFLSGVTDEDTLVSKLTDLRGLISNEATARGNADTALSGRIDAEAAARQQADTALSRRIADEETARANAVSAEANARANADTNLSNRINALDTTSVSVFEHVFPTDGTTWGCAEWGVFQTWLEKYGDKQLVWSDQNADSYYEVNSVHRYASNKIDMSVIDPTTGTVIVLSAPGNNKWVVTRNITNVITPDGMRPVMAGAVYAALSGKLDSSAFDDWLADTYDVDKQQLADAISAIPTPPQPLHVNYGVVPTSTEIPLSDQDFSLLGGAWNWFQKGLSQGGRWSLSLDDGQDGIYTTLPSCYVTKVQVSAQQLEVHIGFRYAYNDYTGTTIVHRTPDWLLELYLEFNGTTLFDAYIISEEVAPPQAEEPVVYTANSPDLNLHSGNINGDGTEGSWANTVTGFLPFDGMRAFIRRGTRCNIKISVYDSGKGFISDLEVRSQTPAQSGYTYNGVWASNGNRTPAFFRLTFFESANIADVNADTWEIAFEPF